MSVDARAVALERMAGMRCCCDTLISGTGELLLFSLRSSSPRVPLKVVQGPYLWHRPCLNIFSRISATRFWSVLPLRLSFFTIPFRTAPPTTLPLSAGRGRAGSLVPSSTSWFQIMVRAGFCTAGFAVCVSASHFLPLTFLPPSSCRHMGGSLQEER